MTHSILRKLMLIAVLLTSSYTFAHDFEVNGIYYNITSDLTVEVTYKGNKATEYKDRYIGSIVVPEKVSYNGLIYSVTSIGKNTFYYCKELTSITIPNSVNSIGEYAFQYCSGLNEITIPSSITSINRSTFESCTNLTSVTIPNSVTIIGNSAFNKCNLTSITIPNSVTNIDNYAFGNCKGLTSVIIPNSVTRIGDGVFQNCSNLTNIIIPNSVTSIGNGAFSGCKSLTSIAIPNSITIIGNNTFQSCSGLTSITIPNSITSIGKLAFAYCSGLTEITIPNSVTSIGKSPFTACYNLSSIIVEQDNIHYDSRDNCNAIIETATNTLIQGCNETIIPNTITNIDSNSFAYCEGLTSIIIPTSVISIGEYAFRACYNLIEIVSGNPIPPTAINNTFTNVPQTATLYVPLGSKDLYKNAEGWNYFTNIVEDDLKTGVESILADDASISVENGNIIVNGVDNAKVEVYSTNGQCVYNGTSTTIPVSAKGIYIVKVNGKSFKVIL